MNALLKRLGKLEEQFGGSGCNCAGGRLRLLSRKACSTDVEWLASLSQEDRDHYEAQERRPACPEHPIGSIQLVTYVSPRCQRPDPTECPDHGPDGKFGSRYR